VVGHPLDTVAESKDRLTAEKDSLMTEIREGKGPNTFRIRSGRLITNDLLENILMLKSIDVRGFIHPKVAAKMSSDVQEVLVREIKAAKRIEVTNFVTNFPEGMKQALVDFIRDGGELIINTNGRAAHRELFPLGIPAEVTFEQVAEFFEAVETPRVPGKRGMVAFYVLRPNKVRKDSHFANFGLPFVHEKSIIIDGKIVVKGSENFTVASERRNNENIIIFESPEFAEYLEKIHNRSRVKYFIRLPYRFFKKYYKKRNRVTRRCVKSLVNLIY